MAEKQVISMRINWIVRIKNKTFWLSIIPAVLLLITSVANVFGYKLDLSDLQSKLLGVVEAVFVVLTVLGVVVDHTTKGLSDSDRAMTYDEPN